MGYFGAARSIVGDINRGTQMKRMLMALAGFLIAWATPAMTLVVQGNTVFATGPVAEDYAQFVDALAKPGIERVVLVNSPGGDLWTGMQIGRLIADKGLHTVAAGYCISSCSIMFMGGTTRSFSDAFRPLQTYLGIHGPHKKDTKQVDPQQAGQIYAFFKQQIGQRFNAELINKALYDMEDAGSLMRVFDPVRKPQRVSYHCRSAQSLRKDCTEFKDQDALTLGLVTTAELTQVAIPDQWRETPQVFGRELAQAITDADGFASALAARQCSTDSCRKLVTDWQNAKEHRAIAVPVQGPGLGTASNRDKPELAFVAAVYACNHVKDRPARLCEAQAVDGFDAREMYAREGPAPAAILAALTPPTERFFANEEFGGTLTSAKGLRTQKMIDITPQSVDGVTVLGTQALVRTLKASAPPTLIDVGFEAQTLPGAHTLLYGGFAFDEAAREQAYQARFEGLLKLLNPDPAAPLVFFAKNREWWHGVNAAQRAKRLGYAQVGWYRGGLDSWKAAGLPLVPTVVRAVVN